MANSIKPFVKLKKIQFENLNSTLHKITFLPKATPLSYKNKDSKTVLCCNRTKVIFRVMINQITKTKYNRDLPHCKITGNEFPGSRKMNIHNLNESMKFFTLHLLKDDLNGYFLYDQPGQPFDRDPGNTSGFDLPPPT